MLNQGIERTSSNGININIPAFVSNDTIWGASEMAVSLSGASKYTDKKRLNLKWNLLSNRIIPYLAF